uniref:EF-hand domain-containing protein n=1 Tax=Vitrella brassicaformis TaxID=1169539 RepID=A0A7S1JVQ2_9ALVE
MGGGLVPRKVRELKAQMIEKLIESKEAKGEEFDEHEIKFIQKKFEALDLNGDGYVDLHELKAGLKHLNFALDERTIERTFQEYVTGRGKPKAITIDQFVEWWYKYQTRERSSTK